MSTREEILGLMQGDEFGGLPQLLAKREEAVPVLLEILADLSMPAYLRHRAAAALGKTKSRNAAAGVEAALADGDPVLRLMAARALVEISGAAAGNALLALVDDPDASVAKVALQGLKAVGEPTALETLERLRVETPDELRQTHAEAAIRAIRDRNA
jgi:HEAT repeat protein